MTLILTYADSRFVVEVSDRRLTLPSGELFDDDGNKAINYANVAAFAYTGLARIRGKPTLDLLADVLSKATGSRTGSTRSARGPAER